MGGGGGGRGRICNFCLDGPIDLKFGMYIVLGKISRYGEKKLPDVAQMLISAFFEDSFHRNRAYARNAIRSVTDVIFLFCFHI